MLDTNVVIHTIRNRPQEARRMFNRHEGDLSMSAVTLMELLYGAEKSEQRERNLRDVASFAARLEVLPYDSDAAAHTGRIRAELARLGEPIGPYDTMIAGHARSRGLTVVTAKTREFDRVPGLVVENWIAPPEQSR